MPRLAGGALAAVTGEVSLQVTPTAKQLGLEGWAVSAFASALEALALLLLPLRSVALALTLLPVALAFALAAVLAFAFAFSLAVERV